MGGSRRRRMHSLRSTLAVALASLLGPLYCDGGVSGHAGVVQASPQAICVSHNG